MQKLQIARRLDKLKLSDSFVTTTLAHKPIPCLCMKTPQGAQHPLVLENISISNQFKGYKAILYRW